MISLANFAVFMGFQSLMPTLPVYVGRVLGQDEAIMGLVTGIFTITAVLIRPWIGLQLDRKGRGVIFLLGLAVFVATVFSYNWASTVGLLLLIRVMQGLGWGASTTAAGTVAADLVPPQRRAEGLGYYGLFSTLSMALAPPLGLAIVGSRFAWLPAGLTSFNVLFTLAAGLGLVGLLLGLLIHYPKVEPVEPKEGKPALIERGSLLPGLVMFFITLTYGGVVTFIQPYASQRGIANIGLYFTIYALMLALTRPVAGALADRRGYRVVIIPGMVATMAALVVLALADSLPLFLLAGVLNGIGFGATQPTLQALTIDMAAPSRRGAANATFFMAFDLGIGVGSMLLGVLAARIGYSNMYLAATLLALAGLVTFLALGDLREKAVAMNG